MDNEKADVDSSIARHDNLWVLFKKSIPVILSFVSIILTMLNCSQRIQYLLFLPGVIGIIAFLVWVLNRWFQAWDFIKTHFIVVMVFIMTTPIIAIWVFETYKTPFQSIKTIKYENQVYLDQGLAKKILPPSDEYFTKLFNHSSYICKYFDSEKLPYLEFNLSFDFMPDISYKQYKELIGCLTHNTDFVYLFKFGSRYLAIKAETEHMKLSYSLETNRCYVFLKYDFNQIIESSLDKFEKIPKIDYRESLLVLVSTDDKFRTKFKNGDIVSQINNQQIINLYNLKKELDGFNAGIPFISSHCILVEGAL